jgi:hypothetical protein
MAKGKVSVLVYRVGKAPVLESIPDTLEAQQKIVDGYIEYVGLPGRSALRVVCNEEGKLRGLSANRILGHDILVGDFFVVRLRGSSTADLTDEDVDYVKRYFDPVKGK